MRSVFISRQTPPAAEFDGSSYLQRSSVLSGVANSKLGTFSAWLRPDADGSYMTVLGARRLGSGTDGALIITRTPSNRLAFQGFKENPTASDLVITTSSTNIVAANGWRHIAASWDMSDTGKRHVVLDGASDISVTTYNNVAIDYTLGTWEIGRDPFYTSDIWTGALADVMWWPGVYVDLSVATNLAALYLAGPVPASRAVSLIGTPAVQFSGPWSAWKTNKGGGGAFTEGGTLTEGAFTF